MISQRKLEANRKNACASTGPKSAAGKNRSARNARRHGLAVPICFDGKLAAQVKALACAIAGTDASAELMALASPIAEAQVDLIRIRQARRGLMTVGPADEDFKRVELIDRYERRALSCRKFAIRAFDEAAHRECFTWARTTCP